MKKKWGWGKEFDIGISGLKGISIWFGDLIVLMATDMQRSPVGILHLDLKKGMVERGMVLESYRRKGIAEQLSKEAMLIAKEAGLDRISGTTYPGNIAIRNLGKKFGVSELILHEKRLDDLQS